MVVFVISEEGKPLMPTRRFGKVRRLLKKGLARVVCHRPFTIQLLYKTTHYTQPVRVGFNTGATVGFAVVVDNGLGGKVVEKGEIRLRRDISKLLLQRREYRRFRRYRKTPYRKPRFLNRRRPEGWLAPSIQHKLDSHIKAVSQVAKILPISKVVVRVASFDIQKIKNPNISGEDYQNGEQKGFWNVREYVLFRDNHTCQICKGKSKDTVLEVHHITPRSKGGTDRPDNLITLCHTCHERLHKGEIKTTLKPKNNGFKPESFMTTVRWKVIDRLRELGYSVSHTYGYLTKNKRINLNLPKTHINDAFVIAGGTNQERLDKYFFIKQVRKCNRKLYKGARSHIKNTAERFIMGFQRFDKVLWKGAERFIFGRRKTGYFDIRKLDGTKVSSSANARKLKLLESAKTFLVELRNVA